ncbi:hypothetical protein KQX54_013614 [Cotesia glomerata]|uniref:Uncharacterized protein n=1 Tax=Cotesia glomerata TaxID=32391 RepID=A0AAV7J9L4_COTGL|nr:hypothetical protein KQX54_013614 [Cotesia glomerata]
MLTAQQLEFIRDLINILRLLEIITKEISEDYVTASKIIPIVSCLTGTHNTMKTSTNIGVKSRTLIMDDIQSQQQLPKNNSEEFDAIEGTDLEKGIWDFHKLLVKKQLST